MRQVTEAFRHFLATACLVLMSGFFSSSASAQDLEPGTKGLGLEDTAYLFVGVCAKNYPNFRKAKKVLVQNGFQAHSKTGTFYDGKRDVSFKLTRGSSGKVCSMVFSSKEKPEELGLLLAVGSTQGTDGNAKIDVDPNTFATRTNSRGGSVMNFTPTIVNNGKQYFRASLSASN